MWTRWSIPKTKQRTSSQVSFDNCSKVDIRLQTSPVFSTKKKVIQTKQVSKISHAIQVLISQRDIGDSRRSENWLCDFWLNVFPLFSIAGSNTDDNLPKASKNWWDSNEDKDLIPTFSNKTYLLLEFSWQTSILIKNAEKGVAFKEEIFLTSAKIYFT